MTSCPEANFEFLHQPESYSGPTSSLLLKLPAEIRNHIWELVVVENSTIVVSTASLEQVKRYEECPGHRRAPPLVDISTYKYNNLQPTLTKVSRQVRQESLKIFYGL